MYTWDFLMGALEFWGWIFGIFILINYIKNLPKC